MASDQSFEDFGNSIPDAGERHLFADALLGDEIQAWLKTQVGRYVVGRARIEQNVFVDWVFSEEATAEKFMEMRSKALAARTLMLWMIEQVNNGLSAEQAILKAEQQQ